MLSPKKPVIAYFMKDSGQLVILLQFHTKNDKPIKEDSGIFIFRFWPAEHASEAVLR